MPPKLPIGWLVAEVSEAVIAQAGMMGVTQICPRADAVTPELIHRLHAEGFVVRAWGVATEELMRQVVKGGAAYLNSDCTRGTMSIEDKLAIQEVIARYSYTYDGSDAEGFAQLFVEDGVFEVFVPGQTTASVRLQSRTEIHEWAARRLSERTGRFTSRHYQSGLLFDELTADSARTRTMVLVTHQGVAEAAPRPTVSGVYHDRWRKTHAGWRLARRAAHVDRDPGAST